MPYLGHHEYSENNPSTGYQLFGILHPNLGYTQWLDTTEVKHK